MVVAGTLPAVGVGLLEERFAVEIGGVPADAAWLRAHAPGAAAIVADPGVPVDEELLAAAGGSLKVVASFGVGYDHIDADAARARGVRVTNTPDVLTNATAELAVTLMLAAARRVAEGTRSCERNGGARGALRTSSDANLPVPPSASWASGALRSALPSC